MSKSHKSAILRSRSIDHQLDEARERLSKEIQLLILGSAGSGKSTFTKQLRILYGDGYPTGERSALRPLVIDNVCDALKLIINHMQARSIDFQNPSNREVAEQVLREAEKRRKLNSPSHLEAPGAICTPRNNTKENVKAVMLLWNDAGVREAYGQRADSGLSLSESYFLEHVDRIMVPDYIPTIQDILYIRKPTLGIQELMFRLNGLDYRVVDVAGQKSQRKKWIHFFEGVTSVIFFTSLSSYSEQLEEEPTTNSMADSLQLFGEISNNEFLKNTDFILFLNKKDELAERLKSKDFRKWFPNYLGELTPEAVTKFVRSEFIKRKPEKQMVYPHACCATDINVMKVIITDAMQIIIDINLRKTQQF